MGIVQQRRSDIVLRLLFAGLLFSGQLLAAGMDPGLLIANAEQVRGNSRFFQNPESPQRRYQLIAVAEQGALQDSRPFSIIADSQSARENYYAAGQSNVSPFFFSWQNSSRGNTASLRIDSATRPYFYRNNVAAVAGSSQVSSRDLAREIYLTLPADIANPARSQVLNSLDDHVHLAFFERDSVTPEQVFIDDPASLVYSADIKMSAVQFAPQPGFQGNTNRPDVGSRVLASISWREDADGDGVAEVYLVEINIGGQSGIDHWQSDGVCVKDDNSHAAVVSGQYLVLGHEVLDEITINSLDPENIDWQSIAIPWGRILQSLTRRAAGNCRLDAALDIVPNTIGLGFAIEVRGAVRQSLSIAGATAGNDVPGATLEDVPVTVQTVPDAFQPAPAVPSNVDSTSTPVEAACVNPAQMSYGFYRFGSTVFYVNGSPQDTGVRAYCLNPLSPAGEALTTACDFPQDITYAGECEVADNPLETRTPQSVQTSTENPAAGQTQEQTTAYPFTLGSNSIEGMSDGWYQVQSPDSGESFCEGQVSCSLAAGRYRVINHSTGERWENIIINATQIASPAGILLTNGVMSWTEPGWYEVQSALDSSTVCNGESSCRLPDGVYHVINHSTGVSWRNVIVARPASSE